MANYNNTYKNHVHQDYLYYDIDVINSKKFDDGKKITLSYSDIRDKPIISDTSKYYMSIDRVELDGLKLPLFVPKIETGQNDINKTVYKLSIQYQYQYDNGATQTETKTLNIQFFTRNLNSKTPTAPTVKQQYGEYYFVNTYEHFSKMFNDTLALINTSLQTSIRAATSDASITVPTQPVLHYDCSNERFELYLDSKTYGKTGNTFGDTTGTIEFHSRIFFDSHLFALFDGFNHSYTGADLKESNTLGVDFLTYEILPHLDPLNLNIVTINSNTYYKMLPNYDILSSVWSPITSLVFISNIPMQPHLTGSGVKELQDQSGGNSTSLSKIITDIQLPGDSQQYKKKISYFSPAAGYRWTELTKSQNSIREIDFQVYYKLKNDSSLVSIETLNGAHVSILIKFKHKNIEN